MGLYYKINGTWTEVKRPWVRRGDAWRPSDDVWIKRGGAWTKFFEYDVQPPPPPVLQLDLVETERVIQSVGGNGQGRLELVDYGRYIKVSCRMPYAVPDLKRIRILTNYNGKAPTTQYGGTYVPQPDDNYPNEPWSEYHFHGFGSSGQNRDETEWRMKTWPRNADNKSDLKGPEEYFFTAWAEDFAGNWSVGNAASIKVPKKNVEGTDAVVREARFQPLNAGTVANDGFRTGTLQQQGNPRTRGVWFYGNQFNLVGQRGKPAVKMAQIFVQRMNDDGRENANIYLFWHTMGGSGSVPSNGDITMRNSQKIGTLTKGQAKWLKMPNAFLTALEGNEIKGFGLAHKDAEKATYSAADFSVVRSLADSIRSGEVHVVWNEKP